MRSFALAAGFLMSLIVPAFAAGDLSIRPVELEELVLGTDKDTGFGVSQTEYELETGKAYSLAISSGGMHECAWQAPEFFQAVWLRKVEAGEVEIKAAFLYELEFEQAGEAEIFFVPIRTGRFAWRCRGMEERGMAGTFVVK